MRYKKHGWFNESYRHSLAAKGVRTSFGKKMTDEEIVEKWKLKQKIADKDPEVKRFIKIKGKQKTKVDDLLVTAEESWLNKLQRERAEKQAELEEEGRKISEAKANKEKLKKELYSLHKAYSGVENE